MAKKKHEEPEQRVAEEDRHSADLQDGEVLPKREVMSIQPTGQELFRGPDRGLGKDPRLAGDRPAPWNTRA